jgi:hypothetical protein
MEDFWAALPEMGEGLHSGCEAEGKETPQCIADGCIVSDLKDLAITIFWRIHGEV